MKTPWINDTRHYYGQQGINITSELTTSSIISANPSITESGLPFGAILCDKIAQQRGGLDQNLRVLEIGAGLGTLAKEFILRAETEYGVSLDYSIFDFSHEFLALQEETLSDFGNVTFQWGDAHNITGYFDPESFDVIISNEMIADLVTVDNIDPSVFAANSNHEDYWIAESQRFVQEYNIPIYNEAPRLALNVGALQLIESINTLLDIGGLAYVSEHSCEVGRTADEVYSGNLDEKEVGKVNHLSEKKRQSHLVCVSYPKEAELYGHSEYSIKFSHLNLVGKHIELSTELGKVIDLAGINDGTVEMNEADLTEIMPMVGLTLQKLSSFDARGSHWAAWRMLTDSDFFKNAVDNSDLNDILDKLYLPLKTYYADQQYIMLKKS